MSLAKPSTLGELQLYKVLQRANLLSYYETFISQGGDDVQQLCEAGEEEFLEIMALVGMACKPLHVRRLQKALQEWVTRPGIFRATDIHYLPAQSISLTSLGIDTRDLVLPAQSSPRNPTSPSYPREASIPPNQEDDLNSRPLSVCGSAVTTPKSSNGIGNVFRLDDNSRKMNGVATAADARSDAEKPDDVTTSSVLESVVKKYLKSPATMLERKEVIAHLQKDRSQRELAVAIDSDNRPRMEALVRDFVKYTRSPDDSNSRHEVLINDAAVKLCMADERWLMEKAELHATAEKIATEVESKVTRRVSTHLHGSCSQSRLQEVVQHLQNIKSQRVNLHKKLVEAQANKNVIKENECQNILTRIAREEASLLQEKRELTNKMHNGNRQGPSVTVSVESSFSSELADLAKAHNLSFGNLQSLPSTSRWTPQENSTNSQNGDTTKRKTTLENSLSSTDVISNVHKGSPNPERPELLVKIEGEGGNSDAGFPSKNSGSARGSKRKHTSGGAEGTDSKKFLGSESGGD